MEIQSPNGTGGPLVVLQQPSVSEARQRLDYERELQRAAVLSLDQIKAIRSRNEYTEGPCAPRRPVSRPPPRSEKQERTHEVVHVTVNNNYEQRPGDGGQQQGWRGPALSRSTSTGSAASSGSSSSSSGASEQSLLPRAPHPRPAHRPEHAVRTQPKAPAPPDDVLKPLSKGGGPAPGHQFICERCGRCKCNECTAPRTLPSCLACRGQCLCSAESAVEHGTCMCLVKGIFYHCSNDDEGDSCSDRPCSLSRSHCCSRFLCMGAMSLLFPCLLCYPPAKACLRMCQHCYDRSQRPGCRCRNSNTVYCKLDGWLPRDTEKHSSLS